MRVSPVCFLLDKAGISYEIYERASSVKPLGIRRDPFSVFFVLLHDLVLTQSLLSGPISQDPSCTFTPMERIIRHVVLNWIPEFIKRKEVFKGAAYRRIITFLPPVPKRGSIDVLPQTLYVRY